MTPEAYRLLRKTIGTQAEVAKALGVHRVTVVNRERGVQPIDSEAAHALRWISVNPPAGRSQSRGG